MEAALWGAWRRRRTFGRFNESVDKDVERAVRAEVVVEGGGVELDASTLLSPAGDDTCTFCRDNTITMPGFVL